MAEAPWNENTRAMVGARLRRTRTQQNLSVRELAELADLSKTSVVQAEAGRTSRRSTYLKIAKVLGLHVDLLLKPSPADEKPYAVHRQRDDQWFDLTDFDRGPLPDAAQGDSAHRSRLAEDQSVVPLNLLISRLEQGRIKPTILEVSSPSPTRWHPGEEYVFVLEGTAVVSVGEDQLTLGQGESVTFWSAEPHSYAPAPGSPVPVRLLSVRVDS